MLGWFPKVMLTQLAVIVVAVFFFQIDFTEKHKLM